MFQSMVRQQVAEHVLLKCTSRSCAGLSDLLAEPRGRPEDDRGGRNDHAGCSTKVSCGASSLPHARDEHPRYQTAPRGDPGVRSVNCCARRAPFRSPSVGRFCARIDFETRYTKNMLRRSRRRGSRRLLAVIGIENVSTRPGSKPKSSLRAYVVRCSPNIGLKSDIAPCPSCANRFTLRCEKTASLFAITNRGYFLCRWQAIAKSARTFEYDGFRSECVRSTRPRSCHVEVLAKS